MFQELSIFSIIMSRYATMSKYNILYNANLSNCWYITVTKVCVLTEFTNIDEAAKFSQSV